MRLGVGSAPEPSGLPEGSPAMSFAAALFSSPVCLSVGRDPRVSHHGRGGSLAGPRRLWAAPALASRAAVLRAGPPAVELIFLFVFCFILFTDLGIYSKICSS